MGIAVFDWLTDYWIIVSVLLVTAFIACLFLYWQSRHKGWLIGAGGVGALALFYGLLVALLSLYFETDSHRVQRKVERMADALTHQDLDGTFVHVSDDFRGPMNMDK